MPIPLGRGMQRGALDECPIRRSSPRAHERCDQGTCSHHAHQKRGIKGDPTRLSLVGHSGGGTIAALLAASRGDVDCLVTLAAPLDTDAWVENKGLSPLTGSQNPVALLDRLGSVRSHHFVGENDSVVRLEALGEFAIITNNRQVHLVPETSHTLGWTDSWKQLRQLTCLRENS